MTEKPKEFTAWWEAQSIRGQSVPESLVALYAWQASEERCKDQVIEATFRMNAAFEEIRVLREALKYAGRARMLGWESHLPRQESGDVPDQRNNGQASAEPAQ